MYWLAKQLWNIVADVDKRPGGSSSTQSGVVDASSSSTSASTPSPPTQEQTKWDGKDAQAHALIALSVKRHIVPHVRSCTSSKQAWDTLASLYTVSNEARVAFLRKKLEDLSMNDGDSIDVYV